MTPKISSDQKFYDENLHVLTDVRSIHRTASMPTAETPSARKHLRVHGWLVRGVVGLAS